MVEFFSGFYFILWNNVYRRMENNSQHAKRGFSCMVLALYNVELAALGMLFICLSTPLARITSTGNGGRGGTCMKIKILKTP